MEIRDTRYVQTSDGVYLAYQTAGDGPVDFVWQFDHTGDVDLVWEHPELGSWFRELAGFCRIILHDRRGTGLSSRNVPPPNLETRASDLRLVPRHDRVRSAGPVRIRRGGGGQRRLRGDLPRARALDGLGGAAPARRLDPRLPVGHQAGLRGSGGTCARGVGHQRVRGGVGRVRGDRGLHDVPGRSPGRRDAEPAYGDPGRGAGAHPDLARDGRPRGPAVRPGVDASPGQRSNPPRASRWRGTSPR